MEGSETFHCHGNSPPSRSISFFISVSRGDTHRDSRGRQIRTLRRDHVCFYWYSRMFRAPPYTADVIIPRRCYFFKFIYCALSALRHGGHAETQWNAAVTRRVILGPIAKRTFQYRFIFIITAVAIISRYLYCLSLIETLCAHNNALLPLSLRYQHCYD